MPIVDFLHGDILEGGYDLSIFPSSGKGTISSSTRSKAVDVCKIEFPPKMNLGDVSPLYKVNIPNPPTKYIVYGASVLNDYSTFEAIKNIGIKVGELTKSHPEILNVEAPLLGTGAGRLSDISSAKALKEGFEESARDDARLTVFMFGMERLEDVLNFFNNPLATKEYYINAPIRLHDGLNNFLTDTKNAKTAFILMSFEKSKAHDGIMQSIKKVCEIYNIIAVRADDKQYADNLLDNVLIYIYGCDFGIAVFERIKGEIYNPNVSFETGYLMGLQKPILLLKDDTLMALPTDLVGHLYKQFDFLEPESTLQDPIRTWLEDKGFINPN